MRWETELALVLFALAVVLVLWVLALDWWDERQLRRDQEEDDAELDAWLASLSESGPVGAHVYRDGAACWRVVCFSCPTDTVHGTRLAAEIAADRHNLHVHELVCE